MTSDVAPTLEVAVHEFALDGLHGASMDVIAASAGMAKPSLYRRFGSKDGLFEQAIAYESGRLTEHLLAAYASALELPVEDRLAASFDAFLRYAEARPDGFRLLFRTSHHRSSTVADRVDAVRRTVTDRVAMMVRLELAEHGNTAPQAADVLAAMLVGMCEYTAQRMIDEPSWDRRAVVQLMARFAAAGGRGIDRAMLRAVDGPSRGNAPATDTPPTEGTT